MIMKIAVHGLGYVGLVTGLSFAQNEDNTVIGYEVDPEKLRLLEQRKPYIYEKGLQDLLNEALERGNFIPTRDFSKTSEALVDLIAVGTPSNFDGSANLKYVESVAKDIGKNMQGYKVIATKSTVPAGTHLMVEDIVKKESQGKNFDIASIPEFLKEGTAVEDFSKPDRIVIGTKSEKARNILETLFRPYVLNGHPIIHMNPLESEMVKYASNGMLALRIAYSEELSQLADRLSEHFGQEVDVLNVLKGMCADKRIGGHFFKPGPGYGGSCFPKDTQALSDTAKRIGLKTRIIENINKTNEEHKDYLIDRIFQHYDENLEGKTFGLWGLAFKAETDDVRESASLKLVKRLSDKARVQCHDPKATEEFKKHFPESDSIKYFDSKYDALENADALIVMTEWQSFRTPDLELLKEKMKGKTIFDFRNLYAQGLDRLMKDSGFAYLGVGRK